MEFIYKNFINKTEISNIQQLEKQNNYLILSDTIESDFPIYYFAYDNSKLIGILILIEQQDGYEVDSLVDKKYRNQRIFSRLLKLVKSQNPPLDLIISYCPANASLDFRKCSFCKELLYQDLFLTLDKKDSPNGTLPSLPYYVENIDNCYILKKATKGRPCVIGHLNLEFESTFTNVWGVEIKEKYRNQGLGYMLLNYAINDYFSTNTNSLLLHVKSTNAPALALYNKLGFKIHTTISNYLV